MKPRKSSRNSSGKSKNNTLDLVDRISPLPDSILGLILSYLPTTNAVATSILSKRWKFVWITIHNLDFCLKDLKNEMDEDADNMNKMPEDADMKFSQFVNHVLLLHDSGLLNKFRLVWGPRFIQSQVSLWIITAIRRNVCDLVVYVWVPYRLDSNEPSVKHKVLDMPEIVFNANLLQCLELNGSIIVPAEIVVCLPRLETLKLISVFFQSEDDFENLICGCPKLNYLHIDIEDYYITGYSEDYSDFTFIISSTSLRRLELLVKFTESHSNRNLELDASSLEYLMIDGPISSIFVEGCLSSLVEADFRIHMCGDEYNEDNYDPYIEVVRTFDCAKTIILSPDATWALSNGTICCLLSSRD